MALGISYQNVDKSSFLGLRRDHLLFPLAADTNYLSAATAGGAQAAVDISASVVGDLVNRSAQGIRPLIYGRRPAITTVDAAGTNLSVTVRVVGRRFGRQVTQDITATGAGGGETVNGSRVVDEIVSMTIIAIANNAASDTLAVGIDGVWLGLTAPLRAKSDVRMVMKAAAGTPDATGTRYSADVTAAMVNLKDSALDLNALFSALLAVTDQYIVEYEASAAGIETFDRKGLRFN